MIEIVEELRARFDRAATTAGATRPTDAVFANLVARYGEAHRHYHTLAHIDSCLARLDWFCGSAEHAEEVELALWFHDAVYALGDDGNERRSAQLAREHLGALGVSGAVIDRIARHIEATTTHIASGADSTLVVDLDLAILGARPRDFDEFEQQIRREYAHVSEPVYRSARRRVLQAFLARPEIYGVPSIRAELEAAARLNLARRIAQLGDE
jgi:predicted metal-dependent HD superfamily phosphohydrolase